MSEEDVVGTSVLCFLFKMWLLVSILYAFYDFETTQDMRCSDISYEHVPNRFAPCVKTRSIWK